MAKPESVPPAVAAAAPPGRPWLARVWLPAAVVVTLWGFWAFHLYESRFFPFRAEALSLAVSSWTRHGPSWGVVALYARTLALFALWILEAVWVGWVAVRRFGLLADSPLATLLTSLGAGLATFSLLCTGLAFAGWYRPPVFWALFGVGLAGPALAFASDREWRRCWKAAGTEELVRWRDAGSGLFTILVGGLLLFNLAMNFVPEVFYDSLVYHLALPHLYLLEGRLVALPYMNFSWFPQSQHLLYGWTLTLGGDSASRLFNGSTGIFSALALLVLCRQLGRPRAWPAAAAIFLTIPVVSISLWNSGVDLALVLYSLLSLSAALRWVDAPETSRRWLVFAGVCAGMAAGVKYMGGVAPVALLLALAFSLWRSRRFSRRACADLLLMGAVCALWVSPWLLRNALATGNPVYPVLSGIFPSRYLWPEHLRSFMHEVRGIAPHTAWEWLRLPWALATGEPKGPENTCWLGPTFWVLLPAFCFVPRGLTGLSVLVPYTVITFMAEFPFTNQARYLLQGYAPLAVLAALGLAALYDRGPRGVRLFLLAPLLAAVGMNLYAAFLLATANYRPAAVLAGQVSRREYVAAYHPGNNPNPVEPLYDFMRRYPGPVRRVVFVVEEKAYGCPWPYVYGNVYDRVPLLVWNRAAADPAALAAFLKKENVGYILYNSEEAARFRSYGMFDWSEDERNRFDVFWRRYVRPRFAKNGLYLFEVLDDAAAAAEPPAPCPFLSFEGVA